MNKKNQFIENELESKLDQYQSLYNNSLKQKYRRIILSNRKQRSICLYKRKLQDLNRIYAKYDQLESLSDNEISLITNKNQENEQLKLNIYHLKQQILNTMSKTKRHINEYSLLNEKFRLYTQFNNIYSEKQQQCVFYLHQFASRILNLQNENQQLLLNLRNLRKNAMITTKYQQNKMLQQKYLHEIFSHQPILIHNISNRVHIDKELEDYSLFIRRYLKILQECVKWREKLRWINQLYFVSSSYFVQVN